MPKVNQYPHIAALLQPIDTGVDRKVWSISLTQVWTPFFTATNTSGQTAIDADAIGAPLRLQKDKDGTPKFNSNGRPVIRVVKELSDNIRVVRENFAQGLVNYARHIRDTMPDEYRAQVEAAQRAGEPVVSKDNADLQAYIQMIAEAQAEAQAEPQAEPEGERELVAV